MNCLNLLTLIGSIGLFLYGLKLMSEGLLKISGDVLRKVLAATTRNRYTSVLAGILVTALVQSSAATTVMIVSYVNSGLISLVEAMSVIMGANVGTTATTWIIALLGFKLDISMLILPLVALSLPFFNSHSSRFNAWGELLIGLALLFLGLDVLKEVFPDITSSTSLVQFFSAFSGLGYGSILLSLVFGIILTVIVQISTATFVIAALMCLSGLISFEAGCALVLGSNIGTCISPYIVSLKGNSMAKRAAMGHILFNLIGAVWVLTCFSYFCHFAGYLCQAIGLGDPTMSDDSPMGLTLFHTLFNLVNLCLLLPLNRYLVKAIIRFVPESETRDESFGLDYINQGFMSSSGELALLQVQKEVSRYSEETHKMFRLISSMLDERFSLEKQQETVEKVKQMEEESDRAELEIAQFLNQVSSNPLSQSGEQLCRSIYKIVDELESIADSFLHCSVYLYQKSEMRVRFTPEMNTNVQKMVSLVDDAMAHMVKMLALDTIPNNALDKAYNFEDEINNLRNQLRNEMLDSVERKDIAYLQNSFFMMFINECEKVGDYVINVIAAASEK